MSRSRLASIVRLALPVLLCSVLLPSAAAGQGMVFHLDPALLEVLSTSVDSEENVAFRDPAKNDPQSAKFSEYRDLRSGFRLRELVITGNDPADSRYLEFRGTNVGRLDGRLGLDYGTWGGYGLSVDYNKIPHRFGNDGVFLWNVTSPGVFQIADPVQATVQAAIERQRAINPASVNYAFLRGLLTPYLQAANSVDVALQRDRTSAVFEIGKMAGLGWALQIDNENRSGSRPYGISFGFSNAPEAYEPIKYQTSSAELRGDWRGKSAGAQFGARYSRFSNDISTLYWDNPFRAVNSTDPSAYSAPGSGSINGSAVGFADLAPDNEATTLFFNGRAKLGGNWWANGRASFQQLRQDDPLLPYTLNSSIVGIEGTHTFNPTDPASLPRRSADQKVDVTNLAASLGTSFGERWTLAFRFKYYDYDNQAERLELPGYVRFHAVWEEIERFTAPYSYSRQNVAAELGYELGERSNLQLAVERRDFERDFAETTKTSEDALRLSYDTRLLPNLGVRASIERGTRDISGTYDAERGGGATFHEPESTNQPGMRKFNQAGRDYDLWNLQADWSLGDRLTLTGQAQGRKDDYDAEKGLAESELSGIGVELGYALSEKTNLVVFLHRDDVEYFVAARQSGAAPSLNPLDDWSGEFEDSTDTFGLGWTCTKCGKWSSTLTARYSKTDGEADLFSPPGGSPDRAFPIGNYDDVTLWSVDGSLDYNISEKVAAGFSVLYEDYDVNSFRTRGLDPFLPGAPLLDVVNGPYRANVFGLHLRIDI